MSTACQWRRGLSAMSRMRKWSTGSQVFDVPERSPTISRTNDDQLLASCHQQALALADERGLSSVAFPAISTGAFGYPMEPAAWVALGAVASRAGALSSVTRVRFVLRTAADRAVHEAVLAALIRERFQEGAR